MATKSIGKISTVIGGLLSAFILYKIASHPARSGDFGLFPLFILLVLSAYYRLYKIIAHVEQTFANIMGVLFIISIGLFVGYLAVISQTSLVAALFFL